MKTLICLLFLTINAVASPTLLMIATVNNTTSNSPAVGALAYNPALQSLAITHGPLTSTNALAVGLQATLDGTNYVTVGTWKPSNTNAATETIPASAYFMTNYVRIAVTTTNSVTASGTYGQ